MLYNANHFNDYDDHNFFYPGLFGRVYSLFTAWLFSSGKVYIHACFACHSTNLTMLEVMMYNKFSNMKSDVQMCNQLR